MKTLVGLFSKIIDVHTKATKKRVFCRRKKSDSSWEDEMKFRTVFRDHFGGILFVGGREIKKDLIRRSNSPSLVSILKPTFRGRARAPS